MGDSRNTQTRQKQMRQEALREYLSNKCSLEHIIDSIALLDDVSIELDQLMISRKKTALESRIKLLGKYLPDLKSVEVSQDPDGGGFILKVERVVVDAKSTD